MRFAQKSSQDISDIDSAVDTSADNMNDIDQSNQEGLQENPVVADQNSENEDEDYTSLIEKKIKQLNLKEDDLLKKKAELEEESRKLIKDTDALL
jgi:molecular chaperone GrpE (heat shock protein)